MPRRVRSGLDKPKSGAIFTSSNLVTSTIRDGFSAVSFLLRNYAKKLKNGLNSGVLSTATIKLRKLDVKKLTRHKLSNKQTFILSTILDRKITRNPEKRSRV